MKRTFVSLFAALLCCTTTHATVLEPENLLDVMNAAICNLTEAGSWNICSFTYGGKDVLSQAWKEGVGISDLPDFVRAKGCMVLAKCRCTSKDGDAEWYLLIQDVSAPDKVYLVSVDKDSRWLFSVWRHTSENNYGVYSDLQRGIDSVEFFPR